MTHQKYGRGDFVDDIAVERVVNGDRGRIVLNPTERVEAVRRLVHLADSRIADLIGCGLPTIRKIRAHLAQEAHA